MLHGLETSNGDTELLALAGVVDGEGDQLLADTELLCGAGQRTAVEGRGFETIRLVPLRDSLIESWFEIDRKEFLRRIVGRLVP